MRLVSFCAPALRWSLALVLMAALTTAAQAQYLQAPSDQSNEILPPDTEFHAPSGQMQPGVRCATPPSSEAEAAAVQSQLDAFLAEHGDTFRSGGGTVTIPVAFHVVNIGSAVSQGNITQQMIDDQIEVLNEAYDGTTGGSNTTFRFVLDTVDRTTNATWYTGCYGSQENPMKQALNIDPATHLNIYTCQPTGGILGYSYLPNQFPESDYRHGIVILHSSVPGGTAFPYNQGDTATHEVGHYLGLYHTFDFGCSGGDTPPGCQTGGDRVCDTAAEASEAFGCPAGRNTCATGGPDHIENFMDYTDDSCMHLFTAGQSDRMDAMVAQYKPTLWATLGSSCDLSFNAADLSYSAGTRTLTVAVTVHNDGASPHGAQLALDYNRNGGPPEGTKTIGTGTLPAGATVSKTLSVHIPGGAPAGNYNFTLRLIDTGSGTDCDSYQETVSISSPRMGTSGSELEVDRVVDLTPEASAAVNNARVSPNPFARETSIRYEVAEAADVRLAVYDVLGRQVAVLADGRMDAGTYVATFDARGLAAGTYIYRLAIGNDVQTGRMTLTF